MIVEDGRNAFYAGSRAAWRQWLIDNHNSEHSVWLIIYHKKSPTPGVKYEEAVEEAICFGWIDSKPNKRDDESYYLFFAKRKAKSNWSKANRDRATKMQKKGLMAAGGQSMIDLAKETGTWEALKEVQNSVIPEDLRKSLDERPVALKNFRSFPPSSKRIILEWILNAKKPETRQKRIKETVSLAEKNIRANHYRRG
ncbi:MAG: YdeI/OmpD-associated family protein [Saprospiraceae bacterium]|nr:YdeI/OmpD-associated family protein [Saprospiraceae bacterium]